MRVTPAWWGDAEDELSGAFDVDDSSAGVLPIEHAESRNALASVRATAAVTFLVVLNISCSFETDHGLSVASRSVRSPPRIGSELSASNPFGPPERTAREGDEDPWI